MQIASCKIKLCRVYYENFQIIQQLIKNKRLRFVQVDNMFLLKKKTLKLKFLLINVFYDICDNNIEQKTKILIALIYKPKIEWDTICILPI